MSKEKILQLQLALFFETVENRPDKLMGKIDDALEGIFNNMPTILPIPADAPPEIPRVIMQSSNGLYQCNIANSRIDFTANFTNSGNSASIQLESFIEKVRTFAALIFGLKKIVRFGFVGQYFFKNNDPTKRIQSKYLKNDLGDLEELTIRFNKRFENKGTLLNDIIEINKGGFVENGNIQQKGVIIQRDMNNIPGEPLKIEDVISIIVSNENKFRLSGITELF
ncbi:hypothetical protein V7114_20645 [Neobacillus niacini]|uniref:hypothetical protein n=1 Tax=Neobacillus niacini TaxID=86668 RepID=UPI003000D887